MSFRIEEVQIKMKRSKMTEIRARKRTWKRTMRRTWERTMRRTRKKKKAVMTINKEKYKIP